MPMLRLIAKHGNGLNGGPMVPDYEAQAVGARRFIGRRLDPSQGQPFQIDGKGPLFRYPVLVAKEGVDAIHEVDARGPHTAEYLRHLRDGDLLPGDRFTADLAGLPFDPTYEGAAFKAPDPKEETQPTVAELFAASSKPVSTVAPKSPAAPVASSDVKVTQ